MCDPGCGCLDCDPGQCDEPTPEPAWRYEPYRRIGDVPTEGDLL